VYARGSYERALPIGDSGSFDTDRMVAILERVVEDVATRGNCVIVGRGSSYILRSRPDAFHAFIYAPIEDKVRRLKASGKSEREALQLIAEIDHERAAFIRHYFHGEWPHRPLYHVMLNSKCGDDCVVEIILQYLAALEKRSAAEPATI
jgi:cytidylate kinase